MHTNSLAYSYLSITGRVIIKLKTLHMEENTFNKD